MSSEKTDFRFTKKTNGLPDFCILNKEDEPDVQVLTRFLKFIGARKQRKHYEGHFSTIAVANKLYYLKDAKLIDCYQDQEFRRSYFHSIYREIVKKKKHKLPTDSSFELLVFRQVNGNFLLKQEEGENHDELMKLVDPSSIEAFKEYDWMLVVLLNLWEEIKLGLEQLEQIDRNVRESLVASIVAMATLLGPKFFHQATQIHTSLENLYFSHMTKDPDNAGPYLEEDNDEVDRDLLDASSDRAEPPEGLTDDILECLSVLKNRAISLTPENISVENLQALKIVTEHVQTLVETYSSPEVFCEAAGAVLELLMSFGERMEVTGLQDPAFSGLFEGAWTHFLAENASEQFEKGKLAEVLQATLSGTSDVFIEQTSAQSQLIEEEAQLSNCLKQKTSGYIEDRKKKHCAANFEEKLAALKKQLQDLEEQLHEAMLPPGVVIDSLEEQALPLTDIPVMKRAIWEPLLEVLETLRNQYLPEEDNLDPTSAKEELQENASTEKSVSKADETESEELADKDNPGNPEEPEPMEIDAPNVEEEPCHTETLQSESLLDVPEVALSDIPQKPSVLNLPEQDKDSVSEQNESVENTESALKISLEKSLQECGEVLATDANALALNCVAKGLLNFGHRSLQVTKALSSDPKTVINPELIEIAYYGSMVWNTSSNAFVHLQKVLNIVDQKQIELWLTNRATAKITAPLLFSACFQASLFAGNLTIAPTYLNMIKGHLGKDVTDLITDLIVFSNRGGRLSLELLQQTKGVVEKTNVPASILLSDWRDKILNSTRGWAPVRMALTYCLKEGAFKKVVQIIDRGERSQVAKVRDFVKDFSHEDRVRNFMSKAVGEFSKVDAEANARDSFMRTVGDLVEIASRWLEEQVSNKDIQDSNKAFAERLKPRLEAVLKSFQSGRPAVANTEGAMALAVTEASVHNLLDVIDGEQKSIWSDERVTLWFDLPQNLCSCDLDGTDLAAELSWLLAHYEHGFKSWKLYQETLDCEAYHLTSLVLDKLEDQGESVKEERAAIKDIVDKTLWALEKKREALELAVGTANVSGLLNDDRHSVIVSELEYAGEEIKSYSAYKNLRTINGNFIPFQKELDELYAPRIKQLSGKYQELLTKARTSIGPGAVPEEWAEQMESALSNKDIPVVEEMLNALNSAITTGRKLQDEVHTINRIFAGFLEVNDKIYNFLSETQDPRQLAAAAGSENCLGFEYVSRTQNIKSAIRAICDLKRTKQPAEITPPYFSNVSNVLEYVGIKTTSKVNSGAGVKQFKFQVTGPFSYFQAQIECKPAGPPFSDFGKNQNKEANILVAHKNWDIKALEDALKTDLIGRTRMFLVSTTPVSKKMRDRFAEYCKNNYKTIFLIDLSMIYYLGTLPKNVTGSDDIRNYLHLAIPMTFYNSYVGDSMNPPDPEMRYGRFVEIDQLLDMNQGAAVVFAGRQLGKSTILSQVKDQFHAPENKKFSFYFQGDAIFGETSLGGAQENRAKRLWKTVYTSFCDTNFLKPIQNPETEDMRAEIKKCLEKERDLRVMIILDEVDPLLEADHADDFAIFRGMRELVSNPTTKGQFKLIISGLQNVKRFEDSPNYPLNQLGRSMNISIMSISDALSLIKEPLLSYGYQFENSLVPSRIMSITNRHPGLIQIFCYELVRHLAANHKGSVDIQVITDADIIRVFEKDEVRDLIRQRFELTLNLDPRYAIIVYSLALERRGAESFSAAQVREAAAYWLPELSKKTDKQIEAILEELVGLGVFNKVAGQGFSLRNSNIVRLLGTESDILDKMVQAQRRNDTNKDPLTRHAFINKLGTPSPLSFRDEKQILGVPLESKESGEKTGVKVPTDFVVSLVSGSAALGLNQLEQVLSYIDDFYLDWEEDTQQYRQKTFSDVSFTSLRDFDGKLRRQIAQAQKSPFFILIKVTGEKSAEEVSAMVDIALQARDAHKRSFNPCKVVFSLNPKALWDWQSGLVDREKQAQGLIHVNLAPWDDTALQAYLLKIGFPDSDDRVKRLKDYTHGWYSHLYDLAELRKEMPEAKSIPQFGTKYKKVTELTIKMAGDYIDKSGISALDWVSPVLRKLVEEQSGTNFNADDIRLIVEWLEIDSLHESQAEIALNWLLRMNLVETAESKNREAKTLYQIIPSVMHWLAKTQ